jgi:hypothetical protein
LPCKGSAKFRLSEENENKLSFLSVRKLIKPSKIQRKKSFFFYFRAKGKRLRLLSDGLAVFQELVLIVGEGIGMLVE